MSFGSFLRSARLRRHLTLDDLAERTKIKRNLLADLEEDDLSQWPRYLVYRHGYLRSVADVLGLDRDDVLDRFDEAFPEYVPVAFDGGRRVPRLRKGVRPPFFAATRGGIALAVALGLIVGLSLTIAERRRVTLARVEAEVIPDHPGQDVILEPDLPDLSRAMTSLPGTDAVHALNAPLTPRTEGELIVSSSPANAFVTVNGIGRGRTPARVRYLPLGSYTIRVIQFGYRARESHVSLTPDQPVRKIKLALRQNHVTARRTTSSASR